MAKDLTIILEDRPGALAAMGQALGKAGVNMEGSGGFVFEGKGVLHILVEDAGAARRALQGAGIEVHGERDVLVLDIPDQPGELGKAARRMADAGVNIDLVYLNTKGKVVFGVDNMEKARAAM